MTRPLLEMRLRVPLNRFSLEMNVTSCARVLGLFGPSGSGKTTALEAIAGLRRNATGFVRCADAVWLDTESRIELPPEERRTGYVPQDQRLFPHLTVRENLLFGARPGGQFLDEAISLMELAPLLERDTATLSGGERQRVALGRALCAGPALFLLDEPLAALDRPLRDRLLPYLRRVRSAVDAPMIVVSHDPFELQALCDEVVALRDGRVITSGSPRDVFSDPSVLPSGEVEGYRNVYEATIEQSESGLTRIAIGALHLLAPPSTLLPGRNITVSIAASDVLVATEPVTAISARNRFPAKIERIREIGERRLLEIRSHDTPMAVELTPDAIADLHLAPGRSIHCLLKTSAIAIHHPG